MKVNNSFPHLFSLDDRLMQNILTVSALGFKTIALCSNPETFLHFKKISLNQWQVDYI